MESLITSSQREQLILNNGDMTVLNFIEQSLLECQHFYFNVAFVSYGGLQLFVDTIEKAINRGASGKVVTSTYLNFSDPKAIRKLRDFPNVDVKVVTDIEVRGFHSKAYLFENEDCWKIMIGSANITNMALTKNVEWNVMVISKKEDEFASRVIEEFTEIWKNADEADDHFLHEYQTFIDGLKDFKKKENQIFQFGDKFKPNEMQMRAMKALAKIREKGAKKGLVVAATGSGKTYMSAFDSRAANAKRILYMVHREDILRSAAKAFANVFGSKEQIGFVVGSKKEWDKNFVFATIASLARDNNFMMYKPDEFDYIVVDEAHHATAPGYQKLIDYFKPKFMLGMSATPERSDGVDVYQRFDNNVAVDIRLHDAMEMKLVCPFHYFGITDVSGADLTGVNLDDLTAVADKLMINQRVDFIIEKINLYEHDGENLKALGFCVNIEHAKFMAEEFNKRGINATYLTGDNNVDERNNAVRKLQSETDELSVIFTVDVFNEGIDIPSINMVLMLRPTASPIIFVQQLGRGLRKFEDKEYLTVLDFIGNHSRAYMIALALMGNKYYDKDTVVETVKKNFNNISGECNIKIDRIAKEEILKQLELENFHNLKHLKEAYQIFKSVNRNRISLKLMDYVHYDVAPNPLDFIRYGKTYYHFLERFEGRAIPELLVNNLEFDKGIKTLTDMLPIRRPYEYAIIKSIITNKQITTQQLFQEVKNTVGYCDEDSCLHAVKVLNQEFYDSAEKKRWIRFIELVDDKIVISNAFSLLIERYQEYFLDTLDYGIYCFVKDFGDVKPAKPGLVLYKTYSMQETALVSNYNKKISSFRGQGLIPCFNDYYIFVDLKKDAVIREAINYKDKFFTRTHFQWESPNSTRSDSGLGKKLTNNEELGVNLHLFVRKFKTIDNITQPYIYVGKVLAKSYENNKPIKIQYQLVNELPLELFDELTRNLGNEKN